MDKAFSIEESLKFAWKKLKENSGVLFGGSLILCVVSFIFNWVNGPYEKGGEYGNIGLLGFVLLVVSVVLSIGYVIMALNVARGETVSIKQLVPPLNKGGKYFLTSLALGLLVGVGFLLLIIPGVYFMLRFMMAPYAAIDGAKFMDSFKRSTELTEGHKWSLLGFVLVLGIINILGAIPFGLGLIVTTPITYVAFAHVYDQLKKAQHSSPAPATENQA